MISNNIKSAAMNSKTTSAGSAPDPGREDVKNSKTYGAGEAAEDYRMDRNGLENIEDKRQTVNEQRKPDKRRRKG
jgi:hypothetical protein